MSNKSQISRRKTSGSGETVSDNRLPRRVTAMPQVMSHIAQEIRSRYSLAYGPIREGRAGGLRKIKVRVFDKTLRLIVRTRSVCVLPDLLAPPVPKGKGAGK
jgi:hypothetical protein